ncbi:lipopolysaccharide biosynthesis protein [Parasedimentitalea denitrificans]|nr:hypothetical protein [Sedimentitalea sp. CY04]
MSRSMEEVSLAAGLLLLSFTLSSGLVGVLGFDVVIVKLLGRDDPRSDVARKNYADLAARFLGIWVVIALIIAAVLFYTRAGNWASGISPFYVLAWLFLAALQVFQSSVLLAFHRQLASVFYMGVFSNFLALSGIAWTVFTGSELTVAVLARAYLIGLCTSIFLGQLYIHRLIGWVPPYTTFCSNRETGLRPLGTSALTNALSMVVVQMPFWVVAWLGTNAQTVAYGLVFRLTLPLAIILLSARSLVAPVISRAWHRQSLKKVEPYLKQVASLSLITMLAATFCLLMLHNWLFEAVFDKPDTSSFATMVFLLVGQCFLAAFGQGQLTMRLADLQTAALIIGLGTAAIQAISVVVLYHQFGIVGVGASVALYCFLAASLPSLLVYRVLGVNLMCGSPLSVFKSGARL